MNLGFVLQIKVRKSLVKVPPCFHILHCLSFMGKTSENYINKAYAKYLMSVYEIPVKAVFRVNLDSVGVTEPPIERRSPGRTRIRRIAVKYSSGRTCGQCGERGHNVKQ